jgi:predicted kinase
VLIVMSGLPGVGKTSLSRELARAVDGMHLRIDSVEEAIRAAGIATPLDDAGYRVAYAIAEDNLGVGRTVIADSVNPWPLTRDSWRDVGRRADVKIIEIEIICSNTDEHRARVEGRGYGPPWAAVIARDYRPWDRDHIVVDTSGRTLETSIAELLARLEHA